MNTLKQRIRPSFLILFIGWIPNCGKTPSPSRLEGETMASVQTSPEEGSTPNRNRIPEPGPEAAARCWLISIVSTVKFPVGAKPKVAGPVPQAKIALPKRPVPPWVRLHGPNRLGMDQDMHTWCQQGEVAIAGDYGDRGAAQKIPTRQLNYPAPVDRF